MAAGLFQRLWRDCKAAHVLMTRIPLRVSEDLQPADLIRATWAYPLVGITVALAAFCAFYLCHWLNLPPLVCALAAVAVSIAVTGCFHEDGLADTADGFGGGSTTARKLEIMRDSRVGSYGAAALILSISLRAAALSVLPYEETLTALLIAHGLSRAMLPLPTLISKPARGDGLAAAAGRPQLMPLLFALLLAGSLAVFGWGGAEGLLALGLALAATWCMARLAEAQVGGYTGDVLGAIQQVVEVFLLCFAAARLA